MVGFAGLLDNVIASFDVMSFFAEALGANLPDRFIFRQEYYKDIEVFLVDGEVRSKNHEHPQLCHQASYQSIVDRRGSPLFQMPDGGVVNDYVPFYFSPITSFTFTIFRGNVDLMSPEGDNLGPACEEDRVFLVAKVENFRDSGLDFCFSDFALNSNAPLPVLCGDLDSLEEHVHWDMFDEYPYKGRIEELGYNGVCQYFKSMDDPPERMTRSQKRMAEFLVRSAVPLGLIDCLIVKSETIRDKLEQMMDASVWDIPIYVKPGCYYQ
jgi:hypothetical protein